jgi:NADP-dependent 3-hydroxy acid dehydrogenase YdfG
VVVTGANSGIGETAAVLFVKAGATVYGVARRQEAIEESKRRHPETRR